MISLIISTINKQNDHKKYPLDKPKFLLTCPNGNLLIQEVINAIDLKEITNIYIIVLKSDLEKYCTISEFSQIFNNTNIHIYELEEPTCSQPETIYNTICKYNIKGAIYIKDYKTCFKTVPSNDNIIDFVYIDKNNSNIFNVYDKSFIELNHLNEVINICEKQIINDKICAGGYSFKDAAIFVKNYEHVCTFIDINKLHISHIIISCMTFNISFYGREVKHFQDWSYHNDWIQYCNKFKTLFIDIDGTLVVNSGEYFEPKWGNTKALVNNVKYIQKQYETGFVKIILTTARKSSYKELTIKQLSKYNIPYDDIIFDLYHGKRYLINDYSDTNPYPSAKSINLKRNDDQLEKLL